LSTPQTVKGRAAVPTTETTPRRRYAKITEAAEYLNCNERTIREMIADGRITGYRSGPRLIRVDLNDIDANMQAYGGAVS
jgi:excisionase family DNA binding protein